MLNQLRFGRGIDNRKLKAAGFRYRYTSRETVIKLGEHLRLHPILRGAREPYRYEREVEEFLRWSPNVRGSGASRDRALSRREIADLRRALDEMAAESDGANGGRRDRCGKPAGRRRSPLAQYDDLDADEVISLLELARKRRPRGLARVRARAPRRAGVLEAIESALAHGARG